MYNLSEILSSFITLVKFKKEYDSTALDSDLMGTSLSGRYFNQGVSSLVTLKNILKILPLTTDLSIPSYSGTDTYGYNDYVTSGGKYYYSLVDSNTGNLVTDTDYWRETTINSIYLRSKVLSSIETILSKTVQSKYLVESEKNFCIGTGEDTVSNSSKKVGFEIRIKGSDHLKMILNRISTQFSVSESFNIYLYRQNTLVYTISATANTDLSWITADKELSQDRWFLFYDQDDLNGEAYNTRFYYNSEYAEIIPFEIDNTETDLLAITSYTQDSYGLGIDFSIFPDLTNTIKQNKMAYAEVLQLQFNYDMLELFRMNPDHIFTILNRRVEGELKEYIEYELKGDGRHSLVSRLDRSLKKLIDSFKGDKMFEKEDNFITFNSYG